MMTESATSRPQRYMQFGLRSLMILMTACCIVLATLTVPPMMALAIAALFMAVSGVLVITIWRGRGWVRPFAAGAIVPHLFTLFLLRARNPAEALILFLAAELVAVFSGTVAAAYCGYLAKRDGYLPVPDVPYVRDWLSND